MPWISDIPPESRDYKMSLDLVKLWVDFANQEWVAKLLNGKVNLLTDWLIFVVIPQRKSHIP